MIRVDHFWRKFFKIKLPSGDLKYATLSKLIKTLLCIHHGNSDCERSLSGNNKVVTNNRISLGTDTIKGIRRKKELACSTGGAYNIEITQQIFEAVKGAHKKYKRRLEEEAKEKQEPEAQ